MPQLTQQQQSPERRRGPPWGPNQHRQALQEVFGRCYKPLYEESARYIPQAMLKPPYKATQQPLDIKTGAVVNSRGQPSSAVYIKPISPNVVQTWLGQSKPWDLREDFLLDDRVDPKPYNLRQYEGDSLIILLRMYLEKNIVDGLPGLISAHTAWFRGLSYSHKFVNRTYEENADWQLKGTYRQRIQSTSTSPSDPEYNADKPRTMAFMADGAPFQEGVLSTSELATLMFIAWDSSLIAAFQKHRLFPVTLLTASNTQLRLSQAVYDVKHGTVEVRLSQIFELKEGLLKNPEVVGIILGYMAGNPIGKTTW